MKQKTAAILMTFMLFMSLAGCSESADASSDASAVSDVNTTETSDAAEEQDSEESDYDTNEDGMELAEQVDVGYDGMQAVYADSLYAGTYDIEVESSSSMFVVSACTLTVAEDGTMTAQMVLSGTGYGYLYMGTADEAEAAPEDDYIADEAADGEKNTFTVPVSALNSGISCAAYSMKNDYWYDRTLVFRADSLPDEALCVSLYTTVSDLGLSDGTYTCEVTLSGGSGKASVDSPTRIVIADGLITAAITWSSPNYDYMVVDEETYYTVNEEGNSVFEIPVDGFDFPMSVLADTTAMSQPYEIEYTLLFDSASLSQE